MINIVAKREENGEITYLKSEYGNIFSKEDVVKTIKNGVEYYTVSKGRVEDRIYLVSVGEKNYLSTTGRFEEGDSLKRLPKF